MSALPERTVEAARNGFINAAPQSVWGANTASATATLFAAMDPALGPDRLVVAGPFEREIIEKVCALFESDGAISSGDNCGMYPAQVIRAAFIPSPERTT